MKRILHYVIALTLFSVMAKAQLSGSYSVPGTYTSIAAILNDLNNQGISGPVTVNIAAGYTETTPVGGFTLTTSGTSANPIIFQKSGVGSNPLITAFIGGTNLPSTPTQDGIWRFIGCDYITIDGIDLIDPNTSSPGYMEFGYGFLKSNANDGCQNNTIKNCVISLNRDNNGTGSGPAVDGSRGIEFVNALSNQHATALIITSAGGSNSFNKIYGNTIQNCNIGIAMIGFADVSPFSFADNGNDIGGNSIATGNNIINFGGGVSSTFPSAGVRTLAQYNFNVSYNTINNNDGSGVNHTTTLRGIYLNAAISANATILSNTLSLKSNVTTAQVSVIENVSGATPSNNTITISNNLIANCTNSTTTSGIWHGIFNNGASSAYLNINNNTFVNNTTNATTGASYLIYNTGAVNTLININNNSLSFNHIGAAAYTGIMYGLFNNGSTVTTTLNINGNSYSGINHAVTGTGTMYHLYNSGSSNVFNFNNNNLSNLTYNHSSTQYLLYNNSSTQYSLAVLNNTITNLTRNSLAGTTYGYYAGASSLGSSFQNISNNLVSNITATLGGAGTFYGIYTSDGATSPYPNKTIASNTVTNITYSTTGTFYGLFANYMGDGGQTYGSKMYNNLVSNLSSNGTIYGIYHSTLSSPNYLSSVYTNTLTNVATTGQSSIVYATYLGSSGAGVNFYKNKVYDVVATGTAATIYGMYTTSSPISNIYNNLYGNFSTPNSFGLNRLNGMYLLSGTNVNLYYNSIYLNAVSTGTSWGSNGLFVSTTPNVNLRNNIIVNLSTPTGTGVTAAYRRTSATLTTYSATSNNNLFYAGIPSASNLIYTDGTTNEQTLAGYKVIVSPRDASSISENPTFQSVIGSNPNFLNISTSVPTLIESGAAPIAGITDDYIGTTRNTSTPDIGAWEGNYISAGDLLPPNFVASGFTSPVCNTASRTYTVNITDVSGVAGGALSPRSYYKVNAGPYTSTQGTLTAGTATNGVWTFSMSYSALVGDVISYFTVAQDIASTPNLGAVPNAGFAGTSVNNVTTPPTNPYTYTVSGSLAGTYTVGATGTFTTLTDAANAYNNYCLTGPVTYVLTDPSYSTNEIFPVTFKLNTDASATNSLLIIPATANNATIAPVTSTNAVLKFLNARYINVDGLNTNGSALTVNNINTSGAVIWLASTSATGPGNNNLSFNNLSIAAGSTVSGNYGILAGIDGASPATTAGIDNDNITINSNTITSAYYGVYASGTATSAAGLDNWTISNNQIGPVTTSTSNIGLTGVYLSNLNTLSVRNNTISNVQSSSGYIYGLNMATGVRNANVELNTITSIKYTGTGGWGGIGIDVNPNNMNANITIANNMISDITGDGWSSFTAGGFAGIRVATSGSIGGLNIYNNSIALNQSTTIAGSSQANLTAGLYLGVNSFSVDLRNNIFYSDVQFSTNLASKTYAIYSAAPATAFSNIDFNNYYTSGSQANLSFMAAASQTNMASLVAAFGQNASSQNLAPVFNGINDLHLIPSSNTMLDNTGTPIAGITIDIDNQSRSITTPDIGADEYTSPSCTTASSGTLTSSNILTCNNNAVTLSAINTSTGSGTSFQWLVSTSPSGPFINVTGGSGATTPTYITSALTTNTLYYVLRTVCSAVSMTNTSSQATVIINPVPTATAGATTPICAGQNINFTGGSDIATSYNWSGPGSYTSNVQNAVLANAQPTAAGVYTLITTAANCSSSPSTVSVTINSTNLGIVATPNYFCSTGTTTMSVVGNALTYTWSTNAITPSIVETVSATTVYSVVGTGTSNCVATAFATITVVNPTITGIGAAICGTTAIGTLTANSFGPISWYASPSSTTVIGSGNTFTATAPVTTTYYAQANSFSTGSIATLYAGGNSSNGNMFDVFTTNAITINSVDVIITSAVTTTVEVWYRPGTFVGFETSNAGWIPAGTGTVLGAGVGNPVPFNVPLNINLAANSTYGLYITANGGGLFSYTNGAAVGNLISQNADLSVYEGKGGSYFGVTIATRKWNGNIYYTKPGCTSPVIPVTLTVNPTPTLVVTASSPSLCAGNTVTLSASGVDTYTWSTNSTNSTIVQSPSVNTTYTVTGTTQSCNQVDTQTISVSVSPTPTVNLTAGATTICAGAGSIALTGSPAGGAYSGAAVSGSLLSIANSGTFTPMYTFTNSSTGCSNSATTTVIIANCTGINESAETSGLIVYPNPNNGSFVIQTDNFESKNVEVLDVTGRVVYSEKSNNNKILININELANGMYQVRISSSAGTDVIKVIKQ